MAESAKIVHQALDALEKMEKADVHEKVPKRVKPAKGEVYARSEAPRGQLGYYIVADGTGVNPYRVKVKSPCFTAMSIFHVLARGMYIADIIALIGIARRRPGGDRPLSHGSRLPDSCPPTCRTLAARRASRERIPRRPAHHLHGPGPILYVYVESKIAGFMQDRIGPKRVGPYGMLQTVADAHQADVQGGDLPARARTRSCS